METKRCARCLRRAEFSVCFLLSTLGRSPRQQKCTAAVSFCAACIQDISQAMGIVALPALIEPLRQAYTALTRCSGNQSDPAGDQSQ